MSQLLGDERELLIEAYLDGSLDAAGADELARALRAGGDEAASIRERLAFAGLLGQALDPVDADAVARSVAERLDAQGSTSAFVRAVGDSLPPRPFQYRWWLPRTAAAAAVMALAIAGAWWATHRHPAPTEECRVAASTAGSAIERDGVSLPAMPEMPVMAGDVATSTGDLTVRFADRTVLALGEGARMRVLAGGDGKRVLLESGELDAAVAPQQAGHPFTLVTGTARIEVVGTRFTLAAAAASTRLDLHQGAVRLTRLSDGRALDVHAGETVTVLPGGDLSATSLGQPWLPLFPAAGLDGWTQQHGRWSSDGSVVRGEAGEGPSARLLSDRDVSDIDLSCRLRILGAKQAEVQVGTYNWFFTIPSHGDAWVELHLVQSGEDLRCTADGIALPREHGAGRPARAGSLGFYVMSGGTIEIASARLREQQ